MNVFRPSMPPIDEYVEEVRNIWENRWLTNGGPKHQQLEEELLNFFEVQGVSLFSSGHQSLEAAFSIFPSGSEVITTPFTFVSTTLAIIRCGLIPVFCDIEPDFYTMDAEKIEHLITDKTVAIAPVHTYGHLCNWRKIQEIALKYHIKVIYDAAHAFGVSDGEVNAGQLGDISMFSFHATKVFHTIEGGCLTYHDPALSKYFSAWRQFGMSDGETAEILGTNAKLTEFAAAMGLCNLRHLKEQIALRRSAVQRYRERLSEQKGLILNEEQTGVVSNYAYMPVRIIPQKFGYNRDEITDMLAKQSIFARKYFYPLTSTFPICQNKFAVKDTPIAEEISNQILCLPLSADLTFTDVDRICDIILK